MEEYQGKITYDEILLSKEFQAYVINPTDEVKKYWEQILGNDIEKHNEFDKALKINKLLSSTNKRKYSQPIKDKLLNTILYQIEVGDRPFSKVKSLLQRPAFRVAASVILIMTLSFVLSLVWVNLRPANNSAAFTEIIVPSGEKAQVVLPDGSKIWLNSESKLRYPSHFKNGYRDVYLEGEAYFDVSKIKRSKFLVYTQGVKIEVLGTIFNVKSYPGEETVETSVVEGKVKVDASSFNNQLKPVILLPIERAIFYKNFNKAVTSNKIEKRNVSEDKLTKLPNLTVGSVNIKNVTSWKYHLLVFDNETFEEIAVKMSRWYKIQVQIKDDELRKQRFTGKFINNETFYQVLEAISLTTPIEYKYDNNELDIALKRNLHKNRKDLKFE